EERGDPLGTCRAERLFVGGDLFVAVFDEERDLVVAERLGVDDVAARAVAEAAELARDARRGRPVSEVITDAELDEARAEEKRRERGARPKRSVAHRREREAAVSPDERRDQERARDDGDRAGAIPEQRRSRVYDGVVERSAEVTDERIEREDHGRRIEAPHADRRAAERPDQRERDRDRAPAFARARELAREGAPRAADERADAGPEQKSAEPAPQIADAGAETVEQTDADRDARQERSTPEAAEHRRHRLTFAARGRDRDGRPHRGDAGHDEPRGERIFVPEPAEQRDEADPRE